MPVFALDKRLIFPSQLLAEADGLLAVGGDLEINRLLLAYSNGIFPWYSSDHEPILWWCPNPRFVLYTRELKISKSLRGVIKKGMFNITVNTAFAQVIHHCAAAQRPGQYGTWITTNMTTAYIELHKAGYAYSVEAWHNNELTGGLYGVMIGKAFFGESMFSLQSNASKVAFALWAQYLHSIGVMLIDCQTHTHHLQNFGARHIPIEEFLACIHDLTQKERVMPPKKLNP